MMMNTSHARTEKIFPGGVRGINLNFVCQGGGWGSPGLFLVNLICEFNKFKFNKGGGGSQTPDPHSRSAHVAASYETSFTIIKLESIWL